ncbi:hypothetical protein ACFWBB_20680 [Streptomyces sp. NPDC060000]|uniref:hypothetical protein n=1 Tax=Streptomyces sp. NPDC060000 TaxID=3347031 RepID=UPI0036C86B76
MKSEDTPFEGGPMDGRVLPVLLGPTGHPPKTYRIPVPDAAGGPPTVLVYRRVPRGHGKRLGLPQGWKYEFAAGGDKGTGGKSGALGGLSGLKWPWSKPGTEPDTGPGPAPGTPRASGPDATPGDRRDDADE